MMIHTFSYQNLNGSGTFALMENEKNKAFFCIICPTLCHIQWCIIHTYFTDVNKRICEIGGI